MTVVTLIEAPVVQVSAGLDLLDSSGVFVADISADLTAEGSVIARNMANKIHGTATLTISRELAWGRDRVRPWVELSADGQTTTRWNMGVYVMTTPQRNAGETPPTFSVDGYDLLAVLDTPYGSTFSAAAGAVPLTLIASMLTSAGIVNAIDQAAIASTLPAGSVVVWPLAQESTTLAIINDLLGRIGYGPLWIDRDGKARSGPLVDLSSVSPMWAYSTTSATTSVSEQRTATADFFDAANRWVFINDDPGLGTSVEGAGVYTVLNSTDGPTSVTGRGRTITKVVKLQAVTQSALVAQADRIVAADKRLSLAVSVNVGPNPVHWHEDTVTFADADLGVSGLFSVSEWRFDLGGGDMGLQLEAAHQAGPLRSPPPGWAVVQQVSPLLVRFPGDTGDVSVGLKSSGLTFTVADMLLLERVGSQWAVVSKLVAT